MDRVLALHAESRGFDSHRGHMSEDFSDPIDQAVRDTSSNDTSSTATILENSGIRVTVGDCSVTERRPKNRAQTFFIM